MLIATKTLQAIDSALELDGGARYRGLLKEAMSEIGDAFSTDLPEPRNHLGGSLIGRKCAKELWLSHRWSVYEKFNAKTLLLFNRGHLEEARFLAQLRVGGMQVWSQTAEGGQFRISGHKGHFGGALDGVVKGCPDYPSSPILTEFKTHGAKSYAKLVKEGVKKAKFEHYVQMNQYMAFWKLPAALYAAVEKDTDHRHFEIVLFDKENAEQYLDRAGKIIFARTPPPAISDSPAWFDCKFCSKIQVCHYGAKPEMNCRTCEFSEPVENAAWRCNRDGRILSKADQLAGCAGYLVNSGI